MDEARLAELERLCDCATPGPWVYDPQASWPAVRWDAGVFWENDYRRSEGNLPGDLPFIAAARTAIPELIAEVRRLRAIENGDYPVWSSADAR